MAEYQEVMMNIDRNIQYSSKYEENIEKYEYMKKERKI